MLAIVLGVLGHCTSVGSSAREVSLGGSSRAQRNAQACDRGETKQGHSGNSQTYESALSVTPEYSQKAEADQRRTHVTTSSSLQPKQYLLTYAVSPHLQRK